MPSPRKIGTATRGSSTLTFEDFRRDARGLPPPLQLAEFLRLPQQLQAQAWEALRLKLDADDELASAA